MEGAPGKKRHPNQLGEFQTIAVECISLEIHPSL